jgi:hypothetical protein
MPCKERYSLNNKKIPGAQSTLGGAYGFREEIARSGACSRTALS